MRAMILLCAGAALLVVLAPLGSCPAATLSIDDRGVTPLHPGTTAGVGKGAEDEFGTSGTSALSPSPSLALLPQSPLVCRGDGALFSPGIPFTYLMNPNGGGLDAFSTNHAVPPEGATVHIDFSVDRMTTGAAGSSLLPETGFNQQMGDVYGSTHAFPNPVTFVGTLQPGYNGALSSANVGGSNVLLINQGLPSAGVGGLGLATGVQLGVPSVLPAGVMAPTVTSGSHDNLDAFDYASLIANPGGQGGVASVDSYYCITHDEANAVSYAISPSDIFGVPANQPTGGAAWATAQSIGLNRFEDSIDGLVVFDRGNPGGVAEAGIDFALFSLAPGSLALNMLSLDAADVFFTDFTGGFAIYAAPGDLGIVPSLGGAPFAGSNIDALELRTVPEPSTFAVWSLLGVLAAAVSSYRRWKRA